MNEISAISADDELAQGARPLAMLAGEKLPELIRDEVLAEIFAATVASRPDHPAMISGARRLTYAQVWEQAQAQARGLALAGIGPGDMVGLWMPRGIDLLVAQIAITLSGAAWLPFDAEAPVERIATCLDDASAKGLVTQADWKARAAATNRTAWSPQELAAAS
ncbi:AMP-binding protein, partial [Bosea sp. (in: a-proteobacteria)]|uniref:AMP-binding protein n=1 Tax=Bosea sp. (in: a-proteobacteria) TaxID=1871050 RepID=UPI001ACEE703